MENDRANDCHWRFIVPKKPSRATNYANWRDLGVRRSGTYDMVNGHIYVRSIEGCRGRIEIRSNWLIHFVDLCRYLNIMSPLQAGIAQW